MVVRVENDNILIKPKKPFQVLAYDEQHDRVILDLNLPFHLKVYWAIHFAAVQLDDYQIYENCRK